MKLTGLHLLLTYQCNYECDHCFVWGSPSQEGVMTLAQVREIIRQAQKLGTVDWVYLEGGEPFLYYPLMVRAAQEAAEAGFRVGIVTNDYWATTVEDAVEWLRPLVGILQDLSISTDLFHYDEVMSAQARNALLAAERLGIPTDTIVCEVPEGGGQDARGPGAGKGEPLRFPSQKKEPQPTAPTADSRERSVFPSQAKEPLRFPSQAKEPLRFPSQAKGEPVESGAIMFKGRAAVRLVEGVERHPWRVFDECPHEALDDPGRVHVDHLGHVHVCQGLTMGSLFERPLVELVDRYDPQAHPVVGPLLAGGPAALVERYDVPHEDGYVDACHLCYMARRQLRDRFPQWLTPGQMYGEYGGVGV